jgi:hypothetical protein
MEIALIFSSLFFLGSLAFAILLTVFGNDIQGAFGFAVWCVVVALLLGHVAAQPGSE